MIRAKVSDRTAEVTKYSILANYAFMGQLLFWIIYYGKHAQAAKEYRAKYVLAVHAPFTLAKEKVGEETGNNGQWARCSRSRICRVDE